MGIKANLKILNDELKNHNCRLVAVSKTKPNSMIMEAYNVGQRDFGENKVQDLAKKYQELPKDICWHMIGHLQRNKVKYITPFVHLIHGVDSQKLLMEINKQGEKHDRLINCLLQMHIATEESKFGFDQGELIDLLESDAIANMNHIKLSGLMGMATNTSNESLIRSEFQGLKKLFERIKSTYTIPNLDFTKLSMGMSGDYKIAIEEGSTLIRIGTSIFGERNY
ncbi:MAG: YggS family pyridoxal phosphate-dependent enzyme [Bacteroidetes bacterium]|nr:YggS family pyridoxal phosphate-dependent enzyme [Bacteroidota bacterium]MDA1119417.1 YggS family pyridoxal phosphate-dependent enzyme [Bacteroidota bacterium]